MPIIRVTTNGQQKAIEKPNLYLMNMARGLHYDCAEVEFLPFNKYIRKQNKYLTNTQSNHSRHSHQNYNRPNNDLNHDPEESNYIERIARQKEREIERIERRNKINRHRNKRLVQQRRSNDRGNTRSNNNSHFNYINNMPNFGYGYHNLSSLSNFDSPDYYSSSYFHYNQHMSNRSSSNYNPGYYTLHNDINFPNPNHFRSFSMNHKNGNDYFHNQNYYYDSMNSSSNNNNNQRQHVARKQKTKSPIINPNSQEFDYSNQNDLKIQNRKKNNNNSKKSTSPYYQVQNYNNNNVQLQVQNNNNNNSIDNIQHHSFMNINHNNVNNANNLNMDHPMIPTENNHSMIGIQDYENSDNNILFKSTSIKKDENNNEIMINNYRDRERDYHHHKRSMLIEKYQNETIEDKIKRLILQSRKLSAYYTQKFNYAIKLDEWFSKNYKNMTRLKLDEYDILLNLHIYHEKFNEHDLYYFMSGQCKIPEYIDNPTLSSLIDFYEQYGRKLEDSEINGKICKYNMKPKLNLSIEITAS